MPLAHFEGSGGSSRRYRVRPIYIDALYSRGSSAPEDTMLTMAGGAVRRNFGLYYLQPVFPLCVFALAKARAHGS
jgi:hypothetical protein